MTGVQTCALPISRSKTLPQLHPIETGYSSHQSYSAFSTLLRSFGDLRCLSLCGCLNVGGLFVSFNLLGGHFLSLTILDFLHGNIVLLITFHTGLSSASLDFLKGHTDDGLLDTVGLGFLLLVQFVNTDLLVEASPCEGPSKLEWLDLRVEHGAGFGGDEEMGFTISGDVAATTTWPDLVLSV